MTMQAASPMPGVVRGTDDPTQPVQRRGWARLQPAPNSEPPHLQAIHAGKHGVIIKGMHYETFWEWRV